MVFPTVHIDHWLLGLLLGLLEFRELRHNQTLQESFTFCEPEFSVCITIIIMVFEEFSPNVET
jgi:hypothetical protein